VICETIHWVTDGSLPDDETLVLIEWEESDEVPEVSAGFRLCREWHIDGMPASSDTEIIAWAHWPAGSKAAR
jgi:hypothetical protein